MKVDGFFDIETQDWDTFVLGGFTDGTSYYQTTDEDAFAESIIESTGDIWAWNGGLYDAVWLASWAAQRNIRFTAHCAGTRIVSLDFPKGPRIRDSAALIPMSLAKASEMLGAPISKDTGLRCVCGDDCGGYCAIRRGMPDDELARLGDYLKIDCDTGIAVTRHVLEHAELNGYELGSTIGGSAWKTAKARIDGLGAAEWFTSRDYYQARAGYYGGRVFVGRTVADIGYRYDINSAYPAALSTVELPHGNYATCKGQDARDCFKRSRPGIYHAVIDVPYMHIPPLPTRDTDGRVLYQYGRVVGAWSLIEIEYALSLGCAVVEVLSCVVWSHSSVIFDSLMRDIFDVRARYSKKHPISTWQKLFGNSLTGKFAERPTKQRLYVNPPAELIRACNPFDRYCRDKGCAIGKCSGNCRSWTPIGDGRVWVEEFFRLSDCAHVQWSAYLTASTRITWHKAAMLAGPENVVYGDTDSIYTLNQNMAPLVGTELGTWAYEGDFRSQEIDGVWHSGFSCIAPKTYSYTSGGKRHVRGKGLPGIDVDTWDAFQLGEAVTSRRGVRGIRSAARMGGDSLFVRKDLTRKRHGNTARISDRIVHSDGTTAPTRAAG